MESKIKFGQMIDYLRKQNGLTMEEFGDIFGKTKSTVSRWINGSRFPKIPEAEEIADYFDIPFEVLVFGAGTDNNDINLIYFQLNEINQTKVYNYADDLLSQQRTVEVVGQTAAGEALTYGDDMVEEETVSYVPKGADKALYIKGDSMEPVIKDNSIVFYKEQPQVENGEIAIVEIHSEAVTCKKVKFDYENRKIILESLNDKYEDMVFKDDEVRVLGKVLQ